MQHGYPYGQQPFGAAPMGAPQPPLPPGKDPLSFQRGLLTAMIPLHVLMFFAECVSLALQVWSGRFIPADTSPAGRGELVGKLFAAGCFLLWGVAGLVWAVTNLKRLRQPNASAHTSLRLYWAFSAVSCLCLPLGIIGFVNLSRDDVRRAFRMTA